MKTMTAMTTTRSGRASIGNLCLRWLLIGQLLIGQILPGFSLANAQEPAQELLSIEPGQVTADELYLLGVTDPAFILLFAPHWPNGPDYFQDRAGPYREIVGDIGKVQVLETRPEGWLSVVIDAKRFSFAPDAAIRITKSGIGAPGQLSPGMVVEFYYLQQPDASVPRTNTYGEIQGAIVIPAYFHNPG